MANENILVIDDEITSRRPCSLSLKSNSYNVDEAEDGEHGLELFRKNNYQMVITDLKMPGIDGLEVLKQVKAINEDCGVIIMTAYGGVECGVESIKSGAYDYLIKPIKLDELNFKVWRCLEERKLASRVRELDETVALYDISKSMFSTIQLTTLVNNIVGSTKKILKADDVSFMLFDDKEEPHIASSEGESGMIDQASKLVLGKKLADAASKNKEPIILIGGAKNNPEFSNMDGLQKIKSLISVPVVGKSGKLGVFVVFRGLESENFTEADLRKAVIFTSQMASAIENAELFRNLEQEKEKIEVMFARMGDGAIITDSNMNVVMLNHAAESLLGIRQAECNGKNFFNVVEDFEVSPWEKAGEEGKQVVIFDLVRKKGIPLFLSVVATKIRAEEEIGGQILILRNVTEERKEAILKKNFISTISHKLRTPLTSIISAVELLRAMELANMGQKALQIIENQSWHLSSLVNKLLKFSSMESEESLKLDVKKSSLRLLFEDSLAKIAPLIKSNNVKVDITDSFDSIPQVLLDFDKVQEVFENLIENSIKFNDKPEKKSK